MLNNKDLLAKLLASENIHVVRAPVRTASFDIVSRTLTLPQWKDMTEDIEDMLVGHEVGHALFTDMQYLKTENYGAVHGYLNIIEDVRIEKFMKNKYPGLRKSFIQGYKQLNDRDFFEIKDRDLSTMLLIDRINIYFKCGINSGVKFTAEEMEFVRRVDRCDTIADVQALAAEVYEYTKGELKKKKEEAKNNKNLTAEDLEDIEDEMIAAFDDEDILAAIDDQLDYEYDPYSDDEEVGDTKELTPEEKEAAKKFSAGGNEYSPPSDEVQPEELESVTERALKKRLEEIADDSTRVEVWEPKMVLATDEDVIVSYKELFSIMAPDYVDKRDEAWRKNHLKVVADFKTETSRVVNYLVKEFEMRKSATAYKRNTIAKTGNLDVNKLAVYQLKEDLFKRVTITKDSKNHGMVFLLDWSGSMLDNIHDTIKQVITLCLFCQRTQIPYEVYAFTNGFPSRKGEYVYRTVEQVADDYKGFAYQQFNLLQFFTHKMTQSEFNKMCEYLLAYPWHWSRAMNMNSTPLNEALLYMVDYLGVFKKNNSVDKLTFITLTDGEGGSLYAGGRNRSLRGAYNEWDEKGEYKRFKVIHYLHDPITRKQYKLNEDSGQQTRTLLALIKDRYSAKTIGFYIGRNSRRDLAWFVRNNMMSTSVAEETVMVQNLQSEIRKNDFAYLTNCGRDELYLLPQSKMQIKDSDLEVSAEMNSRQIAKAFNKFLDVKKTNRILLNRFVGQIS